MATITNVTLIDSLNGSTEDVETVTFFHPMTGQKMEIELDPSNRQKMGTHLERLSKYFDAAVVVEAPVAPAKPKAAKNTEISKMREWAKSNGFNIGDRGRISAEIQEAYKASQEVIETAPVETEPTAAEELIETLENQEDASVTAMTDQEIGELMAGLEAEHGTPVTEELLMAAVDKDSGQE
jgi:hypothetical protein